MLDDAQLPGSMTFNETDRPSTYLGRSNAEWSLVRLQLDRCIVVASPLYLLAALPVASERPFIAAHKVVSPSCGPT